MPPGLIHEQNGVSAGGSTASPISWRCSVMASVLQDGMTRPAALPSAGQIAPKI
jgi:hypothetical protein